VFHNIINVIIVDAFQFELFPHVFKIQLLHFKLVLVVFHHLDWFFNPIVLDLFHYLHRIESILDGIQHRIVGKLILAQNILKDLVDPPLLVSVHNELDLDPPPALTQYFLKHVKVLVHFEHHTSAIAVVLHNES